MTARMMGAVYLPLSGMPICQSQTRRATPVYKPRDPKNGDPGGMRGDLTLANGKVLSGGARWPGRGRAQLMRMFAAAVALSLFGIAASAEAPVKNAAKFDPRDITGIWMQVGGRAFKDYPLTPEYAAILKKRQDDEAAGKPFNIAGDTCLPAGLVGSMTTGAYPIEIFYQTGGKEILFEKENIGAIYHVYLNRPHKSEDDLRPMFYGDSIGHWEGNTLVIDTISLGASQAFDLITPHSDALHAVQRLTRVSRDTLQDQITVDDTKALLHPIAATVTFKLHPDWELDEYECTNERFTRDDQGYEKIIPAAK